MSIRRLITRIARPLFAAGNVRPGPDELTATVPATKGSLSEYHRLPSFSDRESYHARLYAYEMAGAVRAEWDREAGERAELSRLTLTDPGAAARLLGVDLPWEVADRAITRLTAQAGDANRETVEPVLEAWRYGKAPAGAGADKDYQFVDALRVLQAARTLHADTGDVLLRRLSVQLFGESKRIEALPRQIAFLLGRSEAGDQEDVFSRIGLVKHPQPMLIAGPRACRVDLQDGSIPMPRPYIGIRPDRVRGMEMAAGLIRRLLTIENLASFNEAAECADNPDDLLIIYVAGYPTPSLLSAYRRILESAQPHEVRHWGDIDLGGFRIADRLAGAAAASGYILTPWRMNSAEEAKETEEPAPSRPVQKITEICQRRGWEKEAEGIAARPVFQEQEVLSWIENRED